MKVRYSPQALSDLGAIATYFEERNPAMLPKIHSDIASKLELNKQYPEAGHVQQGAMVRKAETRRYRYILRYRIVREAHEVQIITIRHHRQLRKYEDN